MKFCKNCALLLAFAAVTFQANSQISASFQTGLPSNADPKDVYALNSTWNANSNSITFLSGASGFSWSANIMWEASPIVSTGVSYRSISFTSSENHRSATLGSMLVHFKVNFVNNSRKVVPYFQLEYAFLNSNSLTQESAISTTNGNASQPAFSATSSTNVGVGIDFGSEFKLSGPFSLMISAGFHGIQLSDSKMDDYTKTLSNYPAPPSGIDGAFWLQGAAGIKYYFSRIKKQRDF